MTEEKRNRIMGALTVTVILLIVILAAIVIYQLCILSQAKKQKRQIENDISYFQEQTEVIEDELKYIRDVETKRQKLLEYGYHK